MTYFIDLSNTYTKRQLTLAYERWWAMVDRCTNPNCSAWKNYGGRGIKVCSRWLGEKGFYNYMMDMGLPKKGETLDRINNDLGYSPNNCRWATRLTQRHNQRRVIARRLCGLPPGVSLDKDRANGRRKCWLSRLEVNGKRVLNKRFHTREEAIEARLKAEKEYL